MLRRHADLVTVQVKHALRRFHDMGTDAWNRRVVSGPPLPVRRHERLPSPCGSRRLRARIRLDSDAVPSALRSASSTYTYLLADEASREALLIDPVFEQFARDGALLRELGLALRYTLETHVHADHVTAAWRFRDALGSRIVAVEAAAARRALTSTSTTATRVTRRGDHARGPGDARPHQRLYDMGNRRSTWRSRAMRSSSAVPVGPISSRAIPGALYRSIRSASSRSPTSVCSIPAHDYEGRTVTSVGEEKRMEPACRRRGERGRLRRLHDATSAYRIRSSIDVAVPANLKCGEPGPEALAEAPTLGSGQSGPSAASRRSTRPGSPSTARRSRVLDVREATELTRRPRPHPWTASTSRSASCARGWPRCRGNEPVVCVCRSGRRSAQASVILEEAGDPRRCESRRAA